MSAVVSQFRPDLAPYEDLYRRLHADPELSRHEATTAAAVAERLRALDGVRVLTGVGGHGVVGVLGNGDGPVVLLRAELDALPVLEQTRLPFASTKRMAGGPGAAKEEPVMHACGHDLHMTGLLAAAQLLHAARGAWEGTVVFLFQGDEENGRGCREMVEDGLYDPQKHAVPRPQFVLGGHVMPMKAGSVSIRRGTFNTASESFRVTLYGLGSHGGKPHKSVDPVVLACSVVVKLQTIVSREIDPQDTAVVTVGSVMAGSAPNVIPDEAVVLINIRAFSEASLTRVRESMRRIVNAECLSFRTPRPPLIEPITYFPVLYNDPAATTKLEDALKGHFGEGFSSDIPVSTGSEDIANLATPVNAAVCFWNYGGTDPKMWDEAVQKGLVEQIPGTLHILVEPTPTNAALQQTIAPSSRRSFSRPLPWPPTPMLWRL